MKKLLLFLPLFFSIAAMAQNNNVSANKLSVKESATLMGKTLIGVSSNLNSADSSNDQKLTTAKAMNDLIRLRLNSLPPGNGWNLTGNTGIGTGFIGTTENRSVRFRVNNVETMVLDSLRARLFLSGGQNPLISLKQSLTNYEWQFRVGLGTGAATSGFNIFNNSPGAGGGKVAFYIDPIGNNVAIGTATPYSASRLYVTGGLNGANIDAQPDSTKSDEGNIEVMSANYDATGEGIAIQYSGGQGTNSTFGYENKRLAQLRLNALTNIIRVPGNRSLRFGTNNIEQMVLDSNGRLGIGLKAPLYPLSVVGTIQATNGSESFTIIPGNEAVLSQTGNHDILLSTNSLTRMRILGNGFVGIGGNVPLEALDVNGNVQSNDAFILNQGSLLAEWGNGGSLAFLRTISAHPLQFRTNDTERMRISATGLVGIGQANPTALLHIGGGTTGRASLNIGDGVAPTSPNSGDMWREGNNLFIRLNGINVQLNDGLIFSPGYTSNITSNNTTATLLALNIEDNSHGTLEVVFNAYDNGNNQYAKMKRSVSYKKKSGTLTLNTVRTEGTDDVDGLTVSVTMDSSTGTIRLRITGESGKTIYWNPTITWAKVVPAL